MELLTTLQSRYEAVAARYASTTGRPPITIDGNDPADVASATRRMVAVLAGRTDPDAGPIAETRVTGLNVDGDTVSAHVVAFDAEGRKVSYATIALEGDAVAEAVLALRGFAAARARRLWDVDRRSA